MASEQFPSDWQDKVYAAIKHAQTKDVTKAIFGISFPENWKADLSPFVRSGEISRLFGVRAVSFSGKEVGVFDSPQDQAKAAHSKSAKKAG